jgi:RimJ/RimL family protein N-acetyltransferase
MPSPTTSPTSKVIPTEPSLLGPILETERLLLRPTSYKDFEGFVTLMTDPESAKYIGGPLSRDQVWRGYAAMAGAWVVNGFSMFSVIEKQSGQWIGRVGPWRPAGWPGTEIGYGLIREAWGKGYATEAATASIDWAFDILGWSEVIHCIDVNNLASKETARRLGAQPDGFAQLPAPFDKATVEKWKQSREAWRARK